MANMNVQPSYDVERLSANPRIYLNTEQVKALGVTTPPKAGSRLKFTMEADVERVTQTDDGGVVLDLCVEEMTLLGKTLLESMYPDLT